MKLRCTFKNCRQNNIIGTTKLGAVPTMILSRQMFNLTVMKRHFYHQLNKSGAGTVADYKYRKLLQL